jgi:hypothetical protein
MYRLDRNEFTIQSAGSAFHIAVKMPEDFFKLPVDGQPFG